MRHGHAAAFPSDSPSCDNCAGPCRDRVRGVMVAAWCHEPTPVWLGCWLASVNVVTIGYYGFDKARARGSEGRVPELVLHGLSALGGSPGAYLAMSLFRHKTVKGSFRILFWCIVILQASLAAYVAKLLWWS
jgi:uncharacterized membrane protein YsdA (DUF1294 family)